jgi:hypothetical protein
LREVHDGVRILQRVGEGDLDGYVVIAVNILQTSQRLKSIYKSSGGGGCDELFCLSLSCDYMSGMYIYTCVYAREERERDAASDNQQANTRGARATRDEGRESREEDFKSRFPGNSL